MGTRAKAKAPKKATAKKDGPHLQKLISTAIAESKERKGVSVVAMKKVLAAKGIDVVKANKRINTTLKKMVAAGLVSQTKGTGASGSFKLATKKGKPKTVMKKKRTAKANKPAVSPNKAASPKKAAAKKPAKRLKLVAPKKAKVVKKSPKKARTRSS